MKTYDDFKSLIKTLNKYPTPTDLVYKYEFSYPDMNNYFEKKMNDNIFLKLPLLDDEKKPLLYLTNKYLFNNFKDAEIILDGLNSFNFKSMTNKEILENFIYSEIEGNLGIEGFHCNKNEIQRVRRMPYDDLTSNQEVIIKNMLEAYDYILKEDITIKNINTLYLIVSKNCLKLTEKLAPGQLYRDDDKHIKDTDGNIVDKGVNHTLLKKLMKSLLDYIKEKTSIENEILKPHIIHYYILYLHPYFDLNGRMARLLSHWYSFKYLPRFSLLYLNEAINNKHNKHQYFNAIVTSRETGNDITYFLEYMADVMIKYAIIYRNNTIITDQLEGEGKLLPKSLQTTVKNILTMPKDADGFFSWKRYANFADDDYSKVLYLKHLNQLTNYKVLSRRKVKNAYVYRLNNKRFNLY